MGEYEAALAHKLWQAETAQAGGVPVKVCAFCNEAIVFTNEIWVRSRSQRYAHYCEDSTDHLHHER